MLTWPSSNPTHPFWLHIIIEIPASINFFFNPDEQLASPAPQAHQIIQQYAVLLLVSSLIALIFALRPVDAASRNVSGALAVYHVFPFVRAVSRIAAAGNEEEYGSGLGGPWMHFLAHGACFLGLMQMYISPVPTRVDGP